MKIMSTLGYVFGRIGLFIGTVVGSFKNGYQLGKLGKLELTADAQLREISTMAKTYKLGAIKLHRQYFGSSLYDAKKAVEDILAKQVA